MDITPYETPRKLNRPLLSPTGEADSFKRLAVDCPFVFTHQGRTYMLYIGFDGTGYQTALASGPGPEGPFTDVGMLLQKGDGHGWDSRNAAGNWILSENSIDGGRRLKKYDGKYWMVYHSYPGDGYEVGPGRIGLAYCEDDSLLRWTRLPEPILTPEEGAPWERGGLYKGCLVEHAGRFYVFYNAKNMPSPGSGWTEQTGVAFSDDLRTWIRYEENPVLRVSAGRWDSQFASDPFVCFDERAGRWLMFYFGFDTRHAMEGIAWSQDLLHWEKHPESILRCGSGEAIDTIHAHKPSILRTEDNLYHYYCACRPIQAQDPVAGQIDHFRCITAAKQY